MARHVIQPIFRKNVEYIHMRFPKKPIEPAARQTGSYSTKSQPIVNMEALRARFNGRIKRPSVKLNSSIAIILACLLAGFGGGWLGAYSYNRGRSVIATSTAAKQQYISNESQLIESIAKNVGQSVVSIDVKGQNTTSATDFLGFAFPQTQTVEAAGTGFIISEDGTIVTNRHVVPTGTTSVSVTLSDGTKYDNVQVIGRTNDSSSQDIAFLKITDLKGKSLTPVALGDSSAVQVGDRVIAIGNALGQFQNTVTTGIISGYGRDVTAGDQSGAQTDENLTDLFQTDAAINEGNSGGPLVNINGEVIGINTAIASNAQNIGFAQPVNDLKALISSVLDNGQLQQPYLGVRYVSLTNDLAHEFNLKITRGAYVTSSDTEPAIVSGSPAERAGLKDHDVITKVNNLSIDDKTSLTSALSKYKVGDRVTLTVVRDGKTVAIKVTLGNAPTG
jgi:serine protease Do